MSARNYTLPKGRLYFDPLVDGSLTGEMYIGSTESVDIEVRVETVSRSKSFAGRKRRSASFSISDETILSFSTSNMSDANYAIFFSAEDTAQVIDSAAGVVETRTVILGRRYQLGDPAVYPFGVRNVLDLTVQGAEGVLVEGTDYDLDAGRALLSIKESAVLVSTGDEVTISYDVGGSTPTITQPNSIESIGALRFEADNLVGPNRDLYFNRVMLTPKGSLSLKGSTEWQTLEFSGTVEGALPNGLAFYAVSGYDVNDYGSDETERDDDFGDLSVYPPALDDDYGDPI